MTTLQGTTSPEQQDPTPAEETPAPLVFQCTSCFQIVADSFSWVCSHRQLNSITVRAATKSVVVSDVLDTSREGVDLGSTTTKLSCSNCSTILGRIYKTTPRWLDPIRDMYTFDVDKITSYELGSDEPTAVQNITLFTASVDYILSRMARMESVCLSLNERVGELEKTTQVNGTSVSKGRGSRGSGTR